MIRKYIAFSILILVLATCAPDTSSISAPEVGAEATASPTEGSQETQAPAPSNSVMDPCALITQAEAEQALGKETSGPEPGDTPPVYSCSYETSDFDLIQVVVVVYDDNTQAQTAYQMAIDFNGYSEISGLGDRAYNAQPIFDVNVLKGNVELSIDISDSTDEATQLQNSIELAQIALSRLP